MITAGIIGGTGFTAGELIRILLRHPEVGIDFVYSSSKAGIPIAEVHQDLIGETELFFSQEINPEVQVVFLCLGHGNSKEFLNAHQFSSGTKIIDLSSDFRLEAAAGNFVYGIPEFRKEDISQASFVANPGCFATGINLALLPLAAEGRLGDAIHINGVTGSTGAGAALSPTTHFTWRDNNFSTYKAFEHQHLKEIYQNIGKLQPGFDQEINFIPNRGNFSRGIYLSLYTHFNGSQEEARAIFETYYKSAPFTLITQQEVHLKQVVNTNKCLLSLQKIGNKLFIVSALDNLLKGAAGQAVQNMNLMFGLEEKTGLDLKANYH